MKKDVTSWRGLLLFGLKFALFAGTGWSQEFITQVGFVDTPGQAVGIALAVSTAYVADFEAGMQVIDVSDPALPTIIGSIALPGHTSSIKVVGSYAYIAGQEAGLEIVNIDDPTSPTLVGSLAPAGGNPLNLDLVGSTVFLPAGDAGLVLVNVSNPAAPSVISTYLTTGAVFDVKVSGSTAYVGLGFASGVDGGAVLEVVDISNPATPTRVGRVGMLSASILRDIALAPPYLYGVLFDAFWVVIDISNPTAPHRVRYVLDGGLWDVFVAGQTACVVHSGFDLFNLQDPSNPALRLSYDAAHLSGKGAALAEPYVYFGDGPDGFRVLRIDHLNSAKSWSLYP